MMAQILNLIIQSISACNDWFISVVNATDAASVIVAFVCVCLAARFILTPIVGGSGFRAVSDKAKRFYSKNHEEN